MPCLPFLSEPEASGLLTHPHQRKWENMNHPFIVWNTSYFAVALTSWQATTTPQSHWKTSHGFRLRSPKVPLKTPPPWCEECTRSSWKLTAAAILLLFSISVLKTNIHLPFNQNITRICIPSSRVITNPETGEIKIKQWSRCWPSVTPLAPAFHYTPTPPPPPHTGSLRQAPRLPATLTKSSSVNGKRWPVTQTQLSDKSCGGGNIYSDLSCVTKQWKKGVVDCFTQKGANLYVHLEENPS